MDRRGAPQASCHGVGEPLGHLHSSERHYGRTPSPTAKDPLAHICSRTALPVAGQTNRLKAAVWREAWIRSARRSDVTLAVSGAVARSVQSWTGRPALVVPPSLPATYGDNPSSFGRKLEGITRIGFVGRLSHEKDPVLFADIARTLASTSFEFHMYGSGAKYSTARWNRDSVSMHGHVDDPREAYAQLDLLLLTSRSEGLGLSVLEASASRVLPLVADVGGAREAICPALRDALVVPSNKRTDVAYWRERILHLSVEPMRSHLMEEQRRYVIERFSPESAAHSLEDALFMASAKFERVRQ